MRTSDNAATASLQFIHPDYGDAWREWQTVDDMCEGSATIKDRGAVYLPKLTGQTDDEYRSYRDRAVVFNATKRTREAMTGMLMRKQPVITLPGGQSEDQPLLADITMSGTSVLQWIRQLATAVVGTGRIVSVIDYNPEIARPYIATYRATDVLNWAIAQDAGHRVLSLLIVREIEEILEEFTVKKIERFRSYRLVDKRVIYRTWTSEDEGYEQAQDQPMTRRGKPLTRIPAVFHNASHLGPEIGEIPLYDVAEINLSHYRTSADLENGRHLAGLPTPYATGVDDEATPMTLGTNRMLTSEKPEAKFGFMEFTGSGLSELTKALEEKERQMAVLGARLLFEQKKDAEAAETVRMRAASEGASLSNIAGHLSVTATAALQWFFWWQGTTEDPTAVPVTVVVNEDFIDAPISSQTLTALIQALQQNAMSFDAFFHQLQQGEIYPDGWDLEKEMAAIAQRPVAMPTMPGGQAGPPGNPPAKPPQGGKPPGPAAKPPAKPPGKKTKASDDQ